MEFGESAARTEESRRFPFRHRRRSAFAIVTMIRIGRHP